MASGLALEAEVVVVTAELTASLLMSDQLPELPESASRTSAQWSSGVAGEAASDVPPAGHAALAEHACCIGACCQTSVEDIHTSALILQPFSIRKENTEFFMTLSEQRASLILIMIQHSFSDKKGK